MSSFLLIIVVLTELDDGVSDCAIEEAIAIFVRRFC